MQKEVKSLVWNILSMTDEINDKGLAVARNSCPKNIFRGWLSLRTKLLKHLSVGLVEKSKKEFDISEIEWHPFSEEVKPEYKTVADKFDDEPIELSEMEKKALKFCYENREEIPITTTEVLDEVEKLLV